MEDPSSENLSIAELAERAGITRRTIRYYVSEGLLPPPGGRGQRRVYTPDHLLRLQAIRRLKEVFLPLREIRRRLEGLTSAELRRIALAPPEELRPSSLVDVLVEPPRTFARSRPSLDLTSVRGLPAVVSQLTRPTNDAWGDAAPLLVSRAAPSATGTPSHDVWHRVTLAPGVELHYQPSGDRRRDETIAHLIRAAASLLAESSPEEG